MCSPPAARAGASVLATAAVLVLCVPLAAGAESAARAREALRPPSHEREARASELYREHRSAGALVGLIEIAALEPQVTDLAPLAAVYSRMADDREALPEVRAYARYRLALVERARGRFGG